MLETTKNFIRDLDIDSGNVRVAIITYSTNVRVEFDLDTFTDRDTITRAVDNIKYVYGDTNTADAIKMMRTRAFSTRNGDRPDVPNVCVIITDGVSNINAYETIPEANLARQQGVEIYAIGIGVSQSRELDGIAGNPSNRFDFENFEDVEIQMETIYQHLCNGNCFVRVN